MPGRIDRRRDVRSLPHAIQHIECVTGVTGSVRRRHPARLFEHLADRVTVRSAEDSRRFRPGAAALLPTLLAWYVGSILAHFGIIQVAGLVGGYTAVGGLSILPLAVLTRLIGYVGMFLVARNALFPRTRSWRLRAWLDDFWRALSVGILPFYAVYGRGAGCVRHHRLHEPGAHGRAIPGRRRRAGRIRQPGGSKEVILTTGTGFWTIAVIVIVFLARAVLGRSAGRRPHWTVMFEVYLEAIWVFFFVVTVQDLLTGAFDWLGTRRVGSWMTDLFDAILAQFGWIGAAWNWAWGEGGAFLFAPLGWLAIAGILAFVEDANDLGGLDVRLLRRRSVVAARRARSRAPGWLRRGVAILGDDWRERFVPFAAAVLRMGGPARFSSAPTCSSTRPCISCSPGWISCWFRRSARTTSAPSGRCSTRCCSFPGRFSRSRSGSH